MPPTARTDPRTTARSPVPGRRKQLLQLLRESPQPRSVASLAGELHVHPNTVRFHLDALLHSGQVEQLLADSTGPGRPPVVFRAVRGMDPTGPTGYRLLSTMLTHHLARHSRSPTAQAAELGREWGPRLIETEPSGPHRARTNKTEALTTVIGTLADLGFAPEPSTSARDTTIRLRHCPFLDVVTDDAIERGGAGSVICSLHLGLMQGVLAAVGGPVTVDRLDPFVEPNLCVAHLAKLSS